MSLDVMSSEDRKFTYSKLITFRVGILFDVVITYEVFTTDLND